MTEAQILDLSHRLARYAILEALRANCVKASDVQASDMVKLYKQLVRSDPWYGNEAKRVLTRIEHRAKSKVETGH